MNENETRVLDIELKKIELEQQKIELEREKLDAEKTKTRWTSLSILIPLLIAVLTFSANSCSQNAQARRDFEMQTAQAQRDFEIQAALIVMDTNKPGTVQQKAKSLAALFPEYLSDGFAASFNPRDFSTPGDTEKRALLRALSATMDRDKIRKEVLTLWSQFYPGDTWAQEAFEVAPMLDDFPEEVKEAFLRDIFPSYGRSL